MREIKFRAWHNLDKEMVYFNNEKLVNDQYQMQHLACLMRGDYGDVLMQFTGLTDKNGVDIYEGDIVDILDHCENDVIMRGQVKFGVYNYPAFEIYDKNNRTYSEEYNSLTNDCDLDFEVIGNVHENPELLDGKL